MRSTIFFQSGNHINTDRYSLTTIAERNGFQLKQTGGGIEALMRNFEGGDYCIVSSGGEVPQNAGMFETCEIGFYSAEGEQQLAFYAPTFLDALSRIAAVKGLPTLEDVYPRDLEDVMGEDLSEAFSLGEELRIDHDLKGKD